MTCYPSPTALATITMLDLLPGVPRLHPLDDIQLQRLDSHVGIRVQRMKPLGYVYPGELMPKSPPLRLGDVDAGGSSYSLSAAASGLPQTPFHSQVQTENMMNAYGYNSTVGGGNPGSWTTWRHAGALPSMPGEPDVARLPQIQTEVQQPIHTPFQASLPGPLQALPLHAYLPAPYQTPMPPSVQEQIIAQTHASAPVQGYMASDGMVCTVLARATLLRQAANPRLQYPALSNPAPAYPTFPGQASDVAAAAGVVDAEVLLSREHVIDTTTTVYDGAPPHRRKLFQVVKRKKADGTVVEEYQVRTPVGDPDEDSRPPPDPQEPVPRTSQFVYTQPTWTSTLIGKRGNGSDREWSCTLHVNVPPVGAMSGYNEAPPKGTECRKRFKNVDGLRTHYLDHYLVVIGEQPVWCRCNLCGKWSRLGGKCDDCGYLGREEWDKWLCGMAIVVPPLPPRAKGKRRAKGKHLGA